MKKDNAINNLDEVITKIEAARIALSEHHIVKLIAISKYNTSTDIKTLYEAGQRAFGENKVQDLASKIVELEDLPIEWHFVGRLQKNKINQLIDLNPALMHSLDSLELASELDKKLKAKNKTMNCLLQINSAYEDSKTGVNPEDAIEVYNTIKKDFSNINLVGVMSIGAHTDDENAIIKSFQITNKISKDVDAKYCSMGMSSDFELAIQNGSNMIRVGSALFKS